MRIYTPAQQARRNELKRLRGRDPSEKAKIAAYNKEYNSRPEVVAARKAFKATAEFKKKSVAYTQKYRNSEKGKQKAKELAERYRKEGVYARKTQSRRDRLGEEYKKWEAEYRNRPHEKARRKAYFKKWMKTPHGILDRTLRGRIWTALFGKKKCASAVELLGCSLDYFREHIQKQFLPGMNWNNKHLWHIDHIIPVSMGDLSRPDHQKILFNYRNCRPLWKQDNLRKKDKLDHSLVTRHELALALEMLK